jgi:ABC-type amino acid transport substrate-binding protein
MKELKQEKARAPGIVVLAFLVALGAIALLPGCAPTERAVLTRENLKGKRVAVMLGYSSDYILSRPEFGLDIYRYDSYGDMQMALRFNRVDAIAMEMDEASVLCRLEPAYRVAMHIRDGLEYAYPIDTKKKELMDSFNSFIRTFRESPEYAEILQRVEAAAREPFVARKVETRGTGDKVLRVALFPGWEPISYVNMTTKEWEGCDVELISHFANSIGVKVEFVDTGDWAQMVLNLMAGKVDLFLCPDSLALKKDLEMSGTITMSEWAFKKDMVLIVAGEGA